MHALQKMFPSLTLFSDLDWEAVTQEYESDYIELSFPEYLQQKALDGDAPLYLFELAYYELALFDAQASNEHFPHTSGVYLNPTALFLSLEFDVKRMIEEASKGEINIYEKEHVLGIFRDTRDTVNITELSDKELSVLQLLEDGPQESLKDFASKDAGTIEQLMKSGLIIAID